MRVSTLLAVWLEGPRYLNPSHLCAARSLASLTFTREDDDGLFVTERLHAWEVVSLANLNPGSVEEALAIIPSLARFREDDVSKALETLATATSRLQM